MLGRLLALLLAGAAVALAVLGIVLGYECGAMASGSSCDAQHVCAFTPPHCLRAVHPFLPALLLAALLGLGAAWMGWTRALLALGVVAAAPSTLAGLSLGFWGLGIALLLVIAGLAAAWPPRGWPAWSALGAALAPYPLLVGAAMAGASPRVVIALTLAPAVAWLALAAISWQRAHA